MTPIWAWARRELRPASPRRARARAPHRRERRGGPHHRRRGPPDADRRSSGSSRRATPPTCSCSTSTDGGRRRRRCSTALRADPDGGAGRARVHHRRLRRGERVRPRRLRRAGPGALHRDRRAPDPRGAAPDPVGPPRGAGQPLHRRAPRRRASATPSRSAPSRAEQFDARTSSTAPAGPTIPLEITGIARDRVRPRRPGVQRRSSARPPSTRSTGARWAASGRRRDRHRRPAHDPGAVVERVISDFELEEVFVSEQLDQTAKVADGTGSWRSACRPSPRWPALAALVAGARPCTAGWRRPADDLPSAARLGLTRTRVHDRRLVLRSCRSSWSVPGSPCVLAIAGSAADADRPGPTAEPDPGVDVDALVLGLGALLLVARPRGHAPRSARCAPPGSAWHAIDSCAGRRPTASLLASGRFSPVEPARAWRWPSTRARAATSVPVRSAIVGAAFGVAGRRRAP